MRNKNEKLIKRVTGAFSLILLVTLIFKIFQLPGGMILSGAFLGGMILGFVIILSLLLSLILKSIFKNIPFFSLLFIVSSIGFLILHYQFYSPTLKIIVPNGYKGDIHLVLSNVEENILKVDEYGIGYINEWTFNKTYARPKVIQENGKDLGNYLIGFNPSNFWGKSIGPENSIRSISFEISSDEYSNEKKYQSLDWLGFVNKNLVLRENPSKGIESNNAIEVKIAQAEDYNTVYQSENLIIEKLSENVYQHISFLQTNDFGKVDCNGMIVVNQNEAIVLDTPADAESSAELIQFISAELNAKINSVTATHFHADCIGGLDEFHKIDVPSYANQMTIDLLKENEKNIPQNGFEKELTLKVGNKKVYLNYFGEGHTKDNIVAYYPDEKTLFGGCLLKENGAGKGNLEDANENAWSETVTQLKQKYPDIQTVIPGHGKRGGMELVDYTIALFRP